MLPQNVFPWVLRLQIKHTWRRTDKKQFSDLMMTQISGAYILYARQFWKPLRSQIFTEYIKLKKKSDRDIMLGHGPNQS